MIHAGDGNDTILIAGSNAIVDRIDGGDGVDTLKVLGAASVTFAHFSALSSSIESWDGNGAGLVGTRADNTFDLRGLTSQTGLSSIRGGFGNDVVFCIRRRQHLLEAQDDTVRRRWPIPSMVAQAGM